MEAKDIKRIQDILIKSKGDTDKMKQLVSNMAASITDITKAKGRADACLEHIYSPLNVKMADIFNNRIIELQGELSGEELSTIDIHTLVTESNCIYFPKGSMYALWTMELVGQLSDGMWENTKPCDHWIPWSNLEALIGPGRFKSKDYIRKDSYNFGALIPIVGDRMLQYGRMGKALGKDIKELNSSLIDYFPNEKFDLIEWKKQLITRSPYLAEERYWDGLNQEIIDKYYATSYTEKEMKEDLKQIKIIMKNKRIR